MPNVVNTDQYQVVQELLARQDEALEQLNQLNERVEAAIKEVNAYRGIEEDEVTENLAEQSTAHPIAPAKAA